MPNASASVIRSAISTQLAAVTELKGGAYVGRTSQFTGFPCVRFYLSAIQEQKDLEDTANSYRYYVYTLDILMSGAIQGVSKAASEAEFEDAVDAVLDRFTTHFTLGGVVEHVSIEPSQIRYEEGPQGVLVYLPLTLYAKTFISV
ncbi:MAG: hypothetical protein AB7O68_16840 [Pirellulales bacterium]